MTAAEGAIAPLQPSPPTVKRPPPSAPYQRTANLAPWASRACLNLWNIVWLQMY